MLIAAFFIEIFYGVLPAHQPRFKFREAVRH